MRDRAVPDLRHLTPREFTAWLRADCARTDAITAAANAAFDRQLRASLKR